jgi:hypothetical protein
VEKNSQKKTKNIMDMKSRELTEHKAVHRRLLREHAELEKQYAQLLAEHNAMVTVAEEKQDNMEDGEEDGEETKAVRMQIRAGTRGHPLVRPFVAHSRTLLATGGSARSIREQLLLNGRFFLGEEDYIHFTEEMPEVRWFQIQREGMGLESMVLTFIRLAKAERVDQWGFDETSLDGVATLNQWCRIVEDNEAVVLTIECAGLLPGSTSAQVTKHVKATWERGAKVVAMVRAELGDSADDLVPVVHGGVHLSKLNGSMHDTCNTANLVAKKVNCFYTCLTLTPCQSLTPCFFQVKVLRDDSGKALYGEDEWKAMEEQNEIAWADFPCANHARNLHFDAFNRNFASFVKETLGPALEVKTFQPLPLSQSRSLTTPYLCSFTSSRP